MVIPKLSFLRWTSVFTISLSLVTYGFSQETSTSEESVKEPAKEVSPKETTITKPSASKEELPDSSKESKETRVAEPRKAESVAPTEKTNADGAKPTKPKLKAKPSETPDASGKIPLPKLGSVTTPMIPGMPWHIHDIRRPRPKPVQPGETSSDPPADARVLFGGKDLSEWYHPGIDDEAFEPTWKVYDGYFEIEPRTGSLLTIDSFGSCQLHLEWMVPEGTTGTSQGRGNSGIKLMERYEVQILDSYNNRTYADGQAGAIYGQYPPMVNAVRQQGKWQTYDIVFEAPKYEGTKQVKPAVLSLLHNGIIVHHHRELTGPTGLRGDPKEMLPPAAPIMLQDHGNRIRFRNIWIRDLP
jgi:hypothetical protein